MLQEYFTSSSLIESSKSGKKIASSVSIRILLFGFVIALKWWNLVKSINSSGLMPFQLWSLLISCIGMSLKAPWGTTFVSWSMHLTTRESLRSSVKFSFSILATAISGWLSSKSALGFCVWLSVEGLTGSITSPTTASGSTSSLYLVRIVFGAPVNGLK